MKWVAPTGLIGITPLASFGPLVLGPSSREGSSASVPEVLVKLDPLQSLLQRKVMLQVQAGRAEVGCSNTGSIGHSLQEGPQGNLCGKIINASRAFC